MLALDAKTTRAKATLALSLVALSPYEKNLFWGIFFFLAFVYFCVSCFNNCINISGSFFSQLCALRQSPVNLSTVNIAFFLSGREVCYPRLRQRLFEFYDWMGDVLNKENKEEKRISREPQKKGNRKIHSRWCLEVHKKVLQKVFKFSNDLVGKRKEGVRN